MGGSAFGKNETPLYAEHLVLGATFGEDGLVRRYANEAQGQDDEGDGCRLADVTHVTTLALFGDVAQSFAEATFAGRKLSVGACEFEAVLTGDGSVASVPLLARTGSAEYVAFDFSSRGAILGGWLDFVGSASKDGYAPYETLGMQDATGTHCMLAMWGDAAKSILADYTPAHRLPAPGRIVSCNLDRIPCIVAQTPASSNGTCYLVLVPPASSAVLWRSLLSFTEVTPVGTLSFVGMLEAANPWRRELRTSGPVRMRAHELAHYGLLRSQADYIGARGLSTKSEGEA